jgi:hypothetical protein
MYMSIASRFFEALQQNIIHNPFYLDWNELGGDLNGLGGPGDSHLKVNTHVRTNIERDNTLTLPRNINRFHR